MSAAFTAACVQLSSAREPEPNIAAAGDLIRRARDAGAALIMTPEVSDMMEPKRPLRIEKARNEANHPMLAAFRELARETGAWLLLGSAVVRREDGDERLANRSFLITPDGTVAQRYDKIHMFDVELAGGESYRESNAFRPGEAAVLAALPWGVLGMTVCYDLRFPQLYRALAQAGADFLSIPSAFTVPTGCAHWHVLMRARAIENGCFSRRRARAARWRRSRLARRQPPRLAFHGGDALDDGRPRRRDAALLEGDDGQAIDEGGQQLARPQQEIRVRRPAEALVAGHEGLVDQRPAGGKRRRQRRQQRPVQVIGDDDPVIALAEAPGAAILEVGLDDRGGGVAGERGAQGCALALSREIAKSSRDM